MLRNALFFVLLAAPAWATAEFPPAIQARYSLGAEPLCQLCHTNGITARGTVTTPFGSAMLARGLVPNDVAALNTALDALTTEMVDSDGDGVVDVEELAAGTDPNKVEGGTGGGAGGGTGTSVGPLRYGCGASAVPELLLLAGLLPLVRRRTRAPRC